jgi:hypothetical protein
MEDTCYKWWYDNYLPLKPKEDVQVKRLTSFELHLLRRQDSDSSISKDDFWGYTKGDPLKMTSLEIHNPIIWWRDYSWLYSTLSLWAFNILIIPVISSKCERVFSSAKKLLTPERNALADDIIEATECLKAW